MTLLGVLFAARWPLIAVVILAYAFRLYRQYYKLKDFKGPRGSGFSSLWMLYAVLTRRTNFKFAEVNEKYGK